MNAEPAPAVAPAYDWPARLAAAQQLSSTGHHASAVLLLDRCAQTAGADFGPQDHRWLDLWQAYADLYASKGEYAQAAECYAGCAAFMAALFGAGAVRTVPYLTMQAQHLLDAGNFEQARAVATGAQAILDGAGAAELAVVPGADRLRPGLEAVLRFQPKITCIPV